MTTTRIERSERTNLRSWRAFGLRALVVVGFAAGAWLLSGSAAQAEADHQSNAVNAASVTDTVAAPLGALMGSVPGLRPGVDSSDVSSNPTASQHVGDEVFSRKYRSRRGTSDASIQVASILTQTMRKTVSTFVELPAEMDKSSVIPPLTDVMASARDLMGPLASRTPVPAGNQVLVGSSSPPVAGKTTGQMQSHFRVHSLSAVSSHRATVEQKLRSVHRVDHEVVRTVRGVSSPSTPLHSMPLIPAPAGPGTGSTGNTGSLFGPHQDGGSLSLVPVSVTHSIPLFGMLLMTSFIGISRDSAADPMVSPD